MTVASLLRKDKTMIQVIKALFGAAVYDSNYKAIKFLAGVIGFTGACVTLVSGARLVWSLYQFEFNLLTSTWLDSLTAGLLLIAVAQFVRMAVAASRRLERIEQNTSSAAKNLYELQKKEQ